MTTSRLRAIAAPFVVAPPLGTRVRTRLAVDDGDGEVLVALGGHLGSLAGADVARRCSQGRLDAKGRAVSRQERKQAMTGACSSRWAGAITRSTEDAWGLAERNLGAEARSLRARTGRIRRRLAVGVGGRRGRTRGYATQAERFDKQRRLQALRAKLAEVESDLEAGQLSVCRGGRRLALTRHHLGEAGIDVQSWRQRWETSRWFICADGEADKAWGNETIRWHPDERWLEVKLPAPLAHMANAPHGRYRLSAPVAFVYRSDDMAAQAATGAVRYDISFEPGKARWYLDASWTTPAGPTADLDGLRHSRVLAVDLNAGHLAAVVLDPWGNPVGAPATVPLDLAGLPAATRDGRLRAAISELLAMAADHGCRAVVIEDLDFVENRTAGREHTGRRPSRGRRGRSFRRLVSGIPTGRFRDRLTQMASNAGVAVIAVDPAYTSRWGAEHWLGPIRTHSADASGHHAAAVVIGRRGLGQRARRRERCDWSSPEDGQQRATNSAMRAMPATTGLSEPQPRKPGDRQAQRQPHQRHKTRPAERASPGDQATQDRSGPAHGAGLTSAQCLGTVGSGSNRLVMGYQHVRYGDRHIRLVLGDVLCKRGQPAGHLVGVSLRSIGTVAFDLISLLNTEPTFSERRKYSPYRDTIQFPRVVAQLRISDHEFFAVCRATRRHTIEGLLLSPRFMDTFG